MFLTLFFLLALFSEINSLSCTAQYQCSSVTTNYNYVQCLNGQCQCLASTGFVGNATTQNQCRCDSPFNVYWLSATPYCIQYPDAVAYELEQAQDAYQLSVIEAVYQSLVWPTPAIIMNDLITGQVSPVASFVDLNAIGRVDPLGQFSTQDGIVEYFYGTVWTGSSRISKINFKKLISQDNIVCLNVVLSFDIYDQAQQNILFSYNLTQSGSFTFNSGTGLIESMDLIIHNLGANSDSTTPDTPATIEQLCFIILSVANCNSVFDPDGYYTDMTDCMNYFTDVYEWGTWDDIYFNGNSSICRYFHSLLAIGRPQIHCPHAGK